VWWASAVRATSTVGVAATWCTAASMALATGCAPLSNPEPESPDLPGDGDGSLVVPGSCEVLAWWPMDEGSGSSVADASGNGRDLTLEGVRWAEGVSGNALLFDAPAGASDHLGSMAWSWDAGLQHQARVSLSLWVEPGKPLLYGQFLAGAGGATSWFNPYALMLDQEWTAQLGVSDGESGLFIDGTAIPLDRWVHIVAVLDGVLGTWALYVDGDLAAEGSQPYAVFEDLDGPFSLGRDYNEAACLHGYDWCFPYAGRMDDVKVMSCALTAEQVTREYEQGWPWDEA
jgi:hypothetical protein